MIPSLCFENDQYGIHTFRPIDLENLSRLAADVFSILSDDHTLRYLPGKRLENLADAEQFLRTQVINYHTKRNYLYFISDKHTGKVVGMIDIVTAELAKEHYKINRYPFFIEFYLGSFASGCYLMTEILPAVIDQLLKQGIERIGAVVNRENIAAKKVLLKARFSRKQRFDLLQDFYEINAV